MDVIQAIEERRSARAYLDKPVGRDILERLVSLATRAPSAINLQPWEFTVASGEEKERLSRLLLRRMRERNVSCGPGARKPLPGYFVDRQRELQECIVAELQKEQASFQDFINEGSCSFYGAPTAIIITIDEAFSSGHLCDIGIVLGYLVLAAHALGLGTCPIGLISAFDDDIKEVLSISEQKRVVIGVAVGYPDPEASINRARSQRVALSEVVRWRE